MESEFEMMGKDKQEFEFTQAVERTENRIKQNIKTELLKLIDDPFALIEAVKRL